MLGGYQRLSNSTIIGDSINRGHQGFVQYRKDGKWVREARENTLPIPHRPDFRTAGIAIHAEGPSHLENIKFLGFRHNQFRKVRKSRELQR